MLRLTDGSDVEVRVVAARQERVATAWGELQAAKVGRIAGGVWHVVSVAEISEVPLAEDPTEMVNVNVGG